MHTTLAAETLKTGEQLTIECVLPPDGERDAQIRPFLAHKPPHYREHIEAALTGNCDDLETRFYIGLLSGEIVGNIMTVEANGVGILGHVHTREDQRRKGICDAIMRHQMEDFRRRNGHVLLLGTGYQSPAYHIYARHGFKDWPNGKPGLMRYDREPQNVFEPRFFASDFCVPVAAHWIHWPLTALLAACPALPYVRSVTLNVRGAALLEGPYCQFMANDGKRPDVQASVLENQQGAVAAFAICVPDTHQSDIQLLDLFAHPSVVAAPLIRLLESLPLPPSKIHCYADTDDAQKIAVLQALGFQRLPVPPDPFHADNAENVAIAENVWPDAGLYTRD